MKKKANFGIIRIQNFCSVKDPLNRIKRQAPDWDKIFANYMSDKGLISRIYKELLKLNSNKIIQVENE